MFLPESEKLNIKALSGLFDNKSECYKLFWFQAILEFVCKGQQEITFEELIDEMLANAWYMVTEYHLNLGPKDTLEVAVKHIHSITGYAPTVKKQKILEWLIDCKDIETIKYKKTLTTNVPYWLQTPFIAGFKSKEWNVGVREIAERMNNYKGLIYYYASTLGLNSVIKIVPEWMDYLVENQEILRGWIQYNMIIYLQRRNPSVPGISDKLYPPQERKLEKVKKYWKLILQVAPVHEIYANKELTVNDISIDHFVPWSYVAHDELWNLHPTTRGINSSKGNNLPDWDIYFKNFAELEYLSYKLMWENDLVHGEFNNCAKEHLNNSEIRFKLYREGLSKETFRGELQEIVYPVYHSAEMCGFGGDWKYTP
ncbi:MAG: HNH endonuclease [Lachnospiraceae bacterium]|nr:HNH endonuclease [Lachnospiraceae bacterium]